MQKFQSNLIDTFGRPVAGVPIYVWDLDNNPVTIYSDNGITTKSNPFNTSSLGEYDFYVKNGRYNIYALINGVFTSIRSDVIFQDLVDYSTIVGFGAAGDGTTDDTIPLNIALTSGKVVDGLGLTYAVTGNITLPLNFKGLINCTLKQLTPTGSDRRTIYANGCSGFVLGRVKVDRNGDTSGGNIQDYAGIYLANCTNYYTYECEVYGGGAGNGITHQTCDWFHEFRSNVHDIKYVTGTVPADDVINGFWYNNCHDFTVDGSVVSDCGAEVLGVFTKKRSRGFAVSGCYNFQFYAAKARRVDQGHDITGGIGNHDFLISGCESTDCNTYSFKAANSAYRGRYEGCVGDGARINFVASGQTEPSNPRPRDIRYVDCISVNAGKNPGYPGVPAQGFRIQEVPTVDSTYPRGVEYDGCVAVDNQVVPTMQYGFASDVLTGNDPTDINRIKNNCKSFGHTLGATVGFTEDNNITGLSRLDGPSPRTLVYETDAPVNEKAWSVSYAAGVQEESVRDDSDSSGTVFRRVTRTGTVVDEVRFIANSVKRGGDVDEERYEDSDNQGRTTQRFDDNSLHNTISRLNYGITASGQGLTITYRYGTGGVLGGTAFRDEYRTTDDWSNAAKHSTEYRKYTVLGGVEFESLRVNPRYVGYSDKPMSYNLAKSAVAVAHTGTVAKTVKVTVPVPASAIGPNGMIRFSILGSMTNNANGKTINVEFDGNQFYNITLTNQAAMQAIGFIRNRNSETSQVGFTNSTSGIGAASIATAAVDTTVSKNLTIAITLANAADTFTIEAYDFDILYGA